MFLLALCNKIRLSPIPPVDPVLPHGAFIHDRHYTSKMALSELSLLNPLVPSVLNIGRLAKIVILI